MTQRAGEIGSTEPPARSLVRVGRELRRPLEHRDRRGGSALQCEPMDLLELVAELFMRNRHRLRFVPDAARSVAHDVGDGPTGLLAPGHRLFLQYD